MMDGVTTRNMRSSLQKYNKLYIVASCWTITDKEDGSCTDNLRESMIDVADGKRYPNVSLSVSDENVRVLLPKRQYNKHCVCGMQSVRTCSSELLHISM